LSVLSKKKEKKTVFVTFSGCPLPTTIYLFKKWIDDISRKFNLSLNELSAGKNACTFVTWTDWDLKICLENECKRKNINKPRYLDAWIDLVNYRNWSCTLMEDFPRYF
jgi:hypothetical protein